MKKIKVIVMGLGPLGIKTVKYAAERNLEIVGAVDINPDIAGKKLGEYCGVKGLDVEISSSIREASRKTAAEVLILTTVSSVKKVAPQIKEIADCGLHVVSTCEELSFPWNVDDATAAEIDQTAKAAGIAVLGTGVNPGFLMDFMPVALTAVCQDVKKVKVSRIQDAQFRRVPFQQKIGAGLTLAEFEGKKRDGSLRHVGLTESMNMIAAAMGWKLDKTEDIIEPVIAGEKIVTESITVQEGCAAGVMQTGKGWVNGKELITLFFKAAVGEPETYDQVEITGTPDICSRISGGINGDIATCAIVINAVKQILRVSPGLKTMTDMPPVSFFE
jgi:4-hydroxy-tetrahydrodipicolinate reductase